MKVNYIGKISEENLPAIFVPYFLESVHAGFPSPASDYIESPIDLNKHLVKNGAATFLVRAQGTINAWLWNNRPSRISC
jgi:DNA polymerase V